MVRDICDMTAEDVQRVLDEIHPPCIACPDGIAIKGEPLCGACVLASAEELLRQYRDKE